MVHSPAKTKFFRWKLAAVLFFVFSGCDDTPGQNTLSDQPFSTQVDALVPQWLKQFDVPGAAIAVMENGKISLLKGYGFADTDAREPMTADHVFNAASVSKAVSAWGVMRLVEEGRIDLDKPVNTYLKRWQLPDGKGPASQVTVRRLLSHTGGISMPSTPGFRWPMAIPDLVQVLAGDYEDSVYANAGTKAEIAFPPGNSFHYSGGGYLILQLLVEDVTGKTFPAYMKGAVLTPLGMDNSQYGWDEALSPQMATPYYASGKPEDVFRLPGYAASSLHASAADLAKWMLAGVLKNQEARHRVISDTAFQIMLTPVAETHLKETLPQMGLGYLLKKTDESLIAGHSGSNAGWRVRVLFSPSTGNGFVALTNSDDGGDLLRALSDLWTQHSGH